MTLTKEEQIQGIYDLKVGYTLGHADIAILKSMARQLLASMEQEPIAWLNDAYLGRGVVDGEAGSEDAGPGYIPVYREPTYTVQPAPVVEDIGEISVGRLPTMNQDDYPGLGDWWVQLRIGKDSDEVLARVYGATPQEANSRAEALACRAAMLQGAEPVTTAYKLPSREHFILLCNQFWNWQEADEINAGEEEPRLEWNGSEFTNRVTQALWRMYQASPGNSPAIPDGCALVPVEPTEGMIAAAMSSDDVIFDTEYDTMFRVQHAVIWQAMLSAAPQLWR